MFFKPDLNFFDDKIGFKPRLIGYWCTLKDGLNTKLLGFVT
jgi:hypothetical protein